MNTIQKTIEIIDKLVDGIDAVIRNINEETISFDPEKLAYNDGMPCCAFGMCFSKQGCLKDI